MSTHIAHLFPVFRHPLRALSWKFLLTTTETKLAGASLINPNATAVISPGLAPTTGRVGELPLQLYMTQNPYRTAVILIAFTFTTDRVVSQSGRGETQTSKRGNR
jgi:hypothetical protein